MTNDTFEQKRQGKTCKYSQSRAKRLFIKYFTFIAAILILIPLISALPIVEQMTTTNANERFWFNSYPNGFCQSFQPPYNITSNFTYTMYTESSGTAGDGKCWVSLYHGINKTVRDDTGLIYNSIENRTCSDLMISKNYNWTFNSSLKLNASDIYFICSKTTSTNAYDQRIQVFNTNPNNYVNGSYIRANQTDILMDMYFIYYGFNFDVSDIDNCTNPNKYNQNATVINVTFFDENGALNSLDFEYTIDYGTTISTKSNSYSSYGTDDNFLICKYPDEGDLYADGIITYLNSSYSFKNLLLSDTINHISIYTQDQDKTTDVLFTVIDYSTLPVENAYIEILQWDTGTNSYTTTEILRTDVNGQAVGKIILNTVYYKFIIKYEGETKLIDPTTLGVRLYVNTRTFQIDTGESVWFDNYDAVNSISTTFRYNNTGTNSYVFDFTTDDSENITGCLKVLAHNSSGEHLLTDSCTSSSSASIVYATPDANCTIFTGIAYFTVDDYTYSVDDSPIDVEFKCDFSMKNIKDGSDEPLFFAWVFIIGLAFVGIASPVLSLVLMCLGILMTIIIGMWSLSYPLLVGIIILVFIIIYKGRK